MNDEQTRPGEVKEQSKIMSAAGLLDQRLEELVNSLAILGSQLEIVMRPATPTLQGGDLGKAEQTSELRMRILTMVDKTEHGMRVIEDLHKRLEV